MGQGSEQIKSGSWSFCFGFVELGSGRQLLVSLFKNLVQVSFLILHIIMVIFVAYILELLIFQINLSLVFVSF